MTRHYLPSKKNTSPLISDLAADISLIDIFKEFIKSLPKSKTNKLEKLLRDPNSKLKFILKSKSRGKYLLQLPETTKRTKVRDIAPKSKPQNTSNNIFHIAALKGNYEFIRVLINSRAYKNKDTNNIIRNLATETCPPDNKTLLEILSEADQPKDKKQQENFKAILNMVKNIDQEVRDDKHHKLRTKIFNLVWEGKLAEIEKLSIDNKNDFTEAIKLRNVNGANVLHIAAQQGKDEIIKWFKQNCSKKEFKRLMNEQTSYGQVPAHFAVSKRIKRSTFDLINWAEQKKRNDFNQMTPNGYRTEQMTIDKKFKIKKSDLKYVEKSTIEKHFAHLETIGHLIPYYGHLISPEKRKFDHGEIIEVKEPSGIFRKYRYFHIKTAHSTGVVPTLLIPMDTQPGEPSEIKLLFRGTDPLSPISVVMDLQGHGPGSRALDTDSEAISEQLLWTINKYCGGKDINLTVAGHSLGGSLAQKYTIKILEKLESKSAVKKGTKSLEDKILPKIKKVTLAILNSPGIPKEDAISGKKALNALKGKVDFEEYILHADGDIVQQSGDTTFGADLGDTHAKIHLAKIDTPEITKKDISQYSGILGKLTYIGRKIDRIGIERGIRAHLAEIFSGKKVDVNYQIFSQNFEPSSLTTEESKHSNQAPQIAQKLSKKLSIESINWFQELKSVITQQLKHVFLTCWEIEDAFGLSRIFAEPKKTIWDEMYPFTKKYKGAQFKEKFKNKSYWAHVSAHKSRKDEIKFLEKAYSKYMPNIKQGGSIDDIYKLNLALTMTESSMYNGKTYLTKTKSRLQEAIDDMRLELKEHLKQQGEAGDFKHFDNYIIGQSKFKHHINEVKSIAENEGFTKGFRDKLNNYKGYVDTLYHKLTRESNFLSFAWLAHKFVVHKSRADQKNFLQALIDTYMDKALTGDPEAISNITIGCNMIRHSMSRHKTLTKTSSRLEKIIDGIQQEVSQVQHIRPKSQTTDKVEQLNELMKLCDSGTYSDKFIEDIKSFSADKQSPRREKSGIISK